MTTSGRLQRILLSDVLGVVLGDVLDHILGRVLAAGTSLPKVSALGATLKTDALPGQYQCQEFAVSPRIPMQGQLRHRRAQYRRDGQKTGSGALPLDFPAQLARSRCRRLV
jgi:hypothetical protein